MTKAYTYEEQKQRIRHEWNNVLVSLGTAIKDTPSELKQPPRKRYRFIADPLGPLKLVLRIVLSPLVRAAEKAAAKACNGQQVR